MDECRTDGCTNLVEPGSSGPRRVYCTTCRDYWRPVPCAGCGKMVSGQPDSLPEGQRRCMECRKNGVGGQYNPNFAQKTETAICIECERAFTYEYRTQRRTVCDDCRPGRRLDATRRNAARYTRDERKDQQLRTQYNISLERYRQMLVAQGNGCYLCGRDASEFDVALAVDHDRRCCPGKRSCGKCVRSLLCRDCNITVGNIENGRSVDEATRLAWNMANYISTPILAIAK